MKSNQKLIVFGTGCLVFVIAGIWAVYLWSWFVVLNRPPAVDDRMSAEFLKIIDADDLNAGITITNFGPVFGRYDDATFLVFNHTDEPIQFPDHSFGLQVYWPDENAKSWEQVEMRISPMPSVKVLSPEVENGLQPGQNTFTLFRDYFTKTDYPLIRIYISGIGVNTETKYGAFIDVDIGEP